MKKDQDALERRLWARMEKLKADHAAKQAPERQIAKITRKPVAAERVAVSGTYAGLTRRGGGQERGTKGCDWSPGASQGRLGGI